MFHRSLSRGKVRKLLWRLTISTNSFEDGEIRRHVCPVPLNSHWHLPKILWNEWLLEGSHVGTGPEGLVGESHAGQLLRAQYVLEALSQSGHGIDIAREVIRDPRGGGHGRIIVEGFHVIRRSGSRRRMVGEHRG